MKTVSAKKKLASFMKDRDSVKELTSFEDINKKPRSMRIAMAPHGCNKTGFMHSVQRRYRRSRFVMREMASVGELPGVLKK